jgi:hypothetical protein
MPAEAATFIQGVDRQLFGRIPILLEGRVNRFETCAIGFILEYSVQK